jgi:hypothetical protein
VAHLVDTPMALVVSGKSAIRTVDDSSLRRAPIAAG